MPLSSVFALVVGLALTMPWLLPPQGGPSPSGLPWLFSMACTGVLASVLPLPSGGRRLLSCWLAAGCLGAVLCINGQTTDVLAAAFVLVLVGTCATMVVNCSANSRAGSWLAMAWLFAGLTSSAIGLCQYFGVEQYFSPWMSESVAGEAFANLRQRNQFATLTNMGLLALLWYVAPASNGQRKTLVSWGMVAAAVLLSVGNAATSSRTGLVQLGLLGAMAWLWGTLRQAESRRVLLVAMLAYAAAALTLPVLAGLDPATSGILARLQDGGPVCASRLTLWSNILHLIGQRPWLGWGWGELDYAHYITLYQGPRFCDILDNAHNLPLHLAVELGIPAALLVCSGLVWMVLRAKPWRETDLTRQLAWGVLAVILLHSLLEYPLWYGPFQMAAGLCFGLLWWGKSVEMHPKYQSNEPQVKMWRVLVAIILIAPTAYAAWDYHRISQIYLAPQARDAAYRDDTMNKIRGSWLFRNQVRFAELTITPLARNNAQWTFNMATAQLHYSPEPRVIEKVIESAVLLGRDDEALAHLARYRAAFPADHARWAQANAQASERLQPLR